MVKYNLVQYIYHGFDKDKLTIDTLSDGYIEFENVEQTRIGWYDNNGNIICTSCNNGFDLSN